MACETEKADRDAKLVLLNTAKTATTAAEEVVSEKEAELASAQGVLSAAESVEADAQMDYDTAEMTYQNCLNP